MSSQPGLASCRSSERRAEIDLALLDPVAIDHEELGVAPSAAVGLLELVGDEDLTVVFDDLLEAEGLDLLAVRPAAFEVSASVKVWIGWAAERKVLGDDGLSQVRSFFSYAEYSLRTTSDAFAVGISTSSTTASAFHQHDARKTNRARILTAVTFRIER
jgi:hypothetical protein